MVNSCAIAEELILPNVAKSPVLIPPMLAASMADAGRLCLEFGETGRVAYRVRFRNREHAGTWNPRAIGPALTRLADAILNTWAADADAWVPVAVADVVTMVAGCRMLPAAITARSRVCVYGVDGGPRKSAWTRPLWKIARRTALETADAWVSALDQVDGELRRRGFWLSV